MLLDLADLLHDPRPHLGVRPVEATTRLPENGPCDRRLAAEVSHRGSYVLGSLLDEDVHGVRHPEVDAPHWEHGGSGAGDAQQMGPRITQMDETWRF